MSTATTETVDRPPSAPPDHPLTPLTADEIRAGVGARRRRTACSASTSGSSTSALDEPHKATSLASPRATRSSGAPGSCCSTGRPASARPRRVGDRRTASSAEQSIDSATDGHVPILDAGVRGHRGVPAADERRWLAAMAKRGLDAANVRAVPLSAGVFGHEDEVGHAHRARARLPPGRPGRPAVGAPRRRRRRLRRPHRAPRGEGGRRALDLPVPAERGDWNADTARRARPHRPEADRDHPARGAELHRRRQRRHLGGLDSSGSASTSARA